MGVHELLASFFARYTKAFTMWLARSAPVEMRCASCYTCVEVAVLVYA